MGSLPEAVLWIICGDDEDRFLFYTRALDIDKCAYGIGRVEDVRFKHVTVALINYPYLPDASTIPTKIPEIPIQSIRS